MTLVLLATLACKQSDVEFPAGIEPLEDSTAAWPAAMAEDIEYNTGTTDDYDWAHANAYVHAPLEQVYPCLRDDRVDVNRREVESWELTEDVEDGYEFSWYIHQWVENLVDLDYGDTWRAVSSVDPDTDDVAIAVIAWKMTAANDFMYLREGSIVAELPEPDITSLELVGHIDTVRTDEETMRLYHQDFFADLLACVYDEPWPTFEE